MKRNSIISTAVDILDYIRGKLIVKEIFIFNGWRQREGNRKVIRENLYTLESSFLNKWKIYLERFSIEENTIVNIRISVEHMVRKNEQGIIEIGYDYIRLLGNFDETLITDLLRNFGNHLRIFTEIQL